MGVKVFFDNVNIMTFFQVIKRKNIEIASYYNIVYYIQVTNDKKKYYCLLQQCNVRYHGAVAKQSLQTLPHVAHY